MSAATEQVELELGLEGGGHLRCSVQRAEAERLLRSFEGNQGGLLGLETGRGRLVLDLRRVPYMREVRRHTLGFGG